MLDEAASKGLKTLLLSGEEFYATNTFLPKLGAISGEVYWLQEEKSVNALASILATHTVEVVCYLRRQDLFAESLYNQMVKQPGTILTCPFEEFLQYVNCALDYYRHLEIWARSFGDAALKVGVFDPKKDMVADFLGLALGISEVSENIVTRIHVNERLAPELLEFKRALNGQQMSPVRRFLSHRAIAELSAEFDESGSSWLTYEQRKRITERYRSGNKVLAERWLRLECPFKDISKDDSSSPCSVSLTPARRKEIERKYREIMQRPGMVAELVLRTTFRTIERLLPFVSYLVRPLRQYRRQHNYNRRLRSAFKLRK